MALTRNYADERACAVQLFEEHRSAQHAHARVSSLSFCRDARRPRIMHFKCAPSFPRLCYRHVVTTMKLFPLTLNIFMIHSFERDIIESHSRKL